MYIYITCVCTYVFLCGCAYACIFCLKLCDMKDGVPHIFGLGCCAAPSDAGMQ